MRKFFRSKENSSYTEIDRKEIILDIEDRFGECMTILHEIVSDDLHIDIAVVPPTDDMDFYKLFTVGMGSKEMNIPKELKRQKLQRAELAMFISKDWIINTDNVKYHWSIQLLKTIAHMPFIQNTWIGEEHTIDLLNAEKFGGFSGALLLSLQSGRDAIILNSGKHLNFYLTIPLFKEEMLYKNQNGYDELLDLFDNNGITPINDFKRKNCCI